MGSIPFRRFKQLVSKYGCQIERRKKEWIVVDQNGIKISGFTVTHGKRVQSNQIKPCYIRAFLEGIKREELVMNRDAALKSAVCFWSQEDDCYLVDSLTFSCPAHGDTPKEAWDRFNRFLDLMYIAYKEGKLRGYTKAGRPSKGGLGMHVRVRPSTKDDIDKLAKKFGISQGEAIDYLANFYEIAVLPHKPGDKPSKPNSMELPPQAVSILNARNVTHNIKRKVRSLKKTGKQSN